MTHSIDSSRDSLHRLSRNSLSTIDTTSRRFRKARTTAEEPKIPDPKLFQSLYDDNGQSQPSSSRLPTLAECATHLELLEVFYVLRQHILKSVELDEVFGTKVIHKEVERRDGTTIKLMDQAFWTRRESKWTRFLEHAVVRFMVWFLIAPDTRSSLRDENPLPPLDVLMVWHAFLLNPRLFRSYCKNKVIYRTEFPWKQIHNAIDNNKWLYSLPKNASDHFQHATGIPSDLYAHMSGWSSLLIKTSLVALSLERSSHMPLSVPLLSPDDPVRRHFEAFHAVDRDFAIQLRDAVVRQTSFVDKMNAHLWIRSPAVDGTLRRAKERYSNFLTLFKLYPKTMFVPTLDIDLVWHTHQCSAAIYYEVTNNLAGKFVNHDDSIVQKKLDTGFDTTRGMYQIRFAEEYRICGCWDCEALLSKLEAATLAQDDTPDMEAMAKEVISDVTYYRCVEHLRRKKKALPVRE